MKDRHTIRAALKNTEVGTRNQTLRELEGCAVLGGEVIPVSELFRMWEAAREAIK